MTNNSPFQCRQAPEIWESITHLGTLRTYQKGETIYYQGESVDQLHYLRSGRVKIVLDDPEGIERLISIIEPGNPFGEAAAFDRLPCYVSAIAMAPSTAFAFETNRLAAAMTQDITLLRAVLNALAHKQRILALQAESMTFYRPSERVALLLSHLSASYGTATSDGNGRRVQVDVPLEELASILGLSRVTISREIAKLLKAGIVTKNRRAIVILDPDALERQLPPVHQLERETIPLVQPA